MRLSETLKGTSMTERYKTLGQTTLAEDLDASETAIDVTSAAALRDSYTTGDTYRIKIDNELMTVTAESGNTLTVTRAAEGTAAATHSNGGTVKQIITAAAFDQMKLDANVAGVSGNSGTSVVNAAVALNLSSGTYQGTGLSVSLPSAGTYLLIAGITGYMLITSGAADIRAKLRNTTDASDATDFGVVLTQDYTDNKHGSLTLTKVLTVAAAKTIEVYAARTFTGTVSNSDIQVRSNLTFVKIANS
jgi:hypothetical protein